MSINALRDGNRIPVAGGVSNADSTVWLPFKIDSVTGRVLVDSTGGGGGSTTFYDNEVASGSGTSFSIAHTPDTGAVHVYGAGQRLVLTNDYTISGTTLTMVNTWSAGDIIVDYRVGGASFVDNEVVSGSVNTFTLANTPVSGSVQLYGAGQRLVLTNDYSISGTTITTVNSWSAGDLTADYRK